MDKRTLRYFLIVAGALVIAAIVFFCLYQDAERRYQALASVTPTPSTAPPNVSTLEGVAGSLGTASVLLRAGSEGSEVTRLQERLLELGYYTSSVDGQFGPATREAVLRFQTQCGLDVDGTVGEQTKTALYADSAPTAAPTPTASPYISPAPAARLKASGVPLLVNRTNPLPETYAPTDLAPISSAVSGDLAILKQDGMLASAEASRALAVMLRAAHADGLTVWQISEGYRTYEYQKTLFDRQVEDYITVNGLSRDKATQAAKNLVADPGTSEHHTGLAFDLTVPGEAFAFTKQSDWIAAHCWEYGFILRYRKDKEDITGFLAEAWHVRYVGTEHALTMRDQNWCLEEYLDYLSTAL